jgi:L-rhamnonate dehydratase
MPFFDAGSEFLGFEACAECGRLSGVNANARQIVSAAAGHRIAAIGITHHRLPLAPAFNAAWDTQPRVHFDATIVRVTTDTGLEGVGSGDRMLGFEGHESLFVGHDPLELERHYRVLSNIDFHYGRCWPLDLAQWARAGQIHRHPSW